MGEFGDSRDEDQVGIHENTIRYPLKGNLNMPGWLVYLEQKTGDAGYVLANNERVSALPRGPLFNRMRSGIELHERRTRQHDSLGRR